MAPDPAAPAAAAETTAAPAVSIWHIRVAAFAALSAMFAVDYARQGGGTPPVGDGYDASGAVWNERLKDYATNLGKVAAKAQRVECGGASLVAGAGASPDAVIDRLVRCGSVVVPPGLLPQLTPTALSGMADFSNSLLESGEVHGWQATDLLPAPHSDKRGDAWPPFASGSPFGQRLVAALLDLGPLLRPLLGDDVALDFVSILYARPGAAAQGWHSEGRDPTESAGGALTSFILKVQVILHDTLPSQGMIHFLSHNQTGKVSQHAKLRKVPAKDRVVPPALEAGSVVLYNPKTMHSGGANTEERSKVVLDVLFKAGGADTITGDDTIERFTPLSRGGEDVLTYSRAWDTEWTSLLAAAAEKSSSVNSERSGP